MTDKRKDGSRWGLGTAFHPQRRKAMSQNARKWAALLKSKPKGKQ